MEQMNYDEFLSTKKLVVPAVGKVVSPDDVHPSLFPFQRDIVVWAVKKGRAALFEDCGLGKTRQQLEWARLIGERTIILAPLNVCHQTVREGQAIGVDVLYAENQIQAGAAPIVITNYEKLHHFDPSQFGAVVLDESSILKSLTGKTRNAIIEAFKDTPYRLACTATPAPNDLLELGNHAAFLGVMTSAEMVSIFFTYDQTVGSAAKTTHGFRIKRHAVREFYRWLSSWSVAVKHPSDLGYSDDGYILPDLDVEFVPVESDYTPEGMLPGFMAGGISATEARKVRRATLEDRVVITAEMVNASAEQWIIWAGLNDEANALQKAIPGAVNVEGKQSDTVKSDALIDFAEGRIRVLITKTSIAGHGVNLQNCSRMVFCGIDYSWEMYYQAIRRIWRFGQSSAVKVYVVTSGQERSIFETIQRKEREATSMTNQLIDASKEFANEELHGSAQADANYTEDTAHGAMWTMMLGDSCKRMAEIPDNSIDLSVYSPPFSDVFIYSASERDLGNSRNLDEFFAHYDFIIRENLRVTKPGRIACVHVSDLKLLVNRDGVRGMKDFTGMVIDAYVSAGWIFRSRITIDKNPQSVAARSKDVDLLFATGWRDSTALAPMNTEYVLEFKKPGENEVPVLPFKNGEMSHEDWISWAHAVWYGIRETDVLNVSVARENDDEKHMCPLQLPLIERCLKLWSNRGETVLSPFAGIGSEGYEAVRWQRRFLGIELKPSYFKSACRNLAQVEAASQRDTLFDWAARQEEVKEQDRLKETVRQAENEAIYQEWLQSGLTEEEI